MVMAASAAPLAAFLTTHQFPKIDAPQIDLETKKNGSVSVKTLATVVTIMNLLGGYLACRCNPEKGVLGAVLSGMILPFSQAHFQTVVNSKDLAPSESDKKDQAIACICIVTALSAMAVYGKVFQISNPSLGSVMSGISNGGLGFFAILGLGDLIKTIVD